MIDWKTQSNLTSINGSKISEGIFQNHQNFKRLKKRLFAKVKDTNFIQFFDDQLESKISF